MLRTRMPRLLEINLRRWLHDRKLPEVTYSSPIPNLNLNTKIATKSPIKEDGMKLDKTKSNNKTKSNKINNKDNN